MIGRYLRGLFRATSTGWNRFWFSAADPASLAVIRIAIGMLLVYSHAVWAINSDGFFGDNSWLSSEAMSAIQSGGYAASALWWVDDSPSLIAAVHGVALLNAVLLTIGLWSRAATPVAFLLTALFANRNPAALYGFDQVLGFVTLYLCVNPGNGWLSIDRWREFRRREKDTGSHGVSDFEIVVARPSVSANIATRLIQLHLCLIYLVAGLAKLKGAAWWSGVAFWGAIGNLEYQTLDMTWLVNWPMIVNLLTISALAWEISYAALVWNRWARPLVLTYAVLLHAGIAVCFGMMTFGLAMIVANVAFVSPVVMRSLFRRDNANPWLAALERSSRSQFSNEPGVEPVGISLH
ncbi:MAG: HTTM domain-containing protein [Rhodopirellula sp.]|nr:HTTM domain-containing protein [Rhodopirellula sp.]